LLKAHLVGIAVSVISVRTENTAFGGKSQGIPNKSFFLAAGELNLGLNLWGALVKTS
jgi:hypothetical protein